MKTQTKITFTALLVIAACLVAFIWGLIHSPITSAANASVLSDTASSYALATALQSNFIEHITWGIVLLLVAIVWLVPWKKNNN